MIMNLEHINEKKKTQLKDILSEISGNKYVRKVVIFGSSIREDCRPDSDLDIAIEWEEDCFDSEGVYKVFTLPVFKTISRITEGNNDVVSIGYEGGLLKDAVKGGVTVYERDYV